MADWLVDDISHDGLRALLREEGMPFQAIKIFTVSSNDPDFEAKKNGCSSSTTSLAARRKTHAGDPMVVLCVDEFGAR